MYTQMCLQRWKCRGISCITYGGILINETKNIGKCLNIHNNGLSSLSSKVIKAVFVDSHGHRAKVKKRTKISNQN